MRKTKRKQIARLTSPRLPPRSGRRPTAYRTPRGQSSCLGLSPITIITVIVIVIAAGQLSTLAAAATAATSSAILVSLGRLLPCVPAILFFFPGLVLGEQTRVVGHKVRKLMPHVGMDNDWVVCGQGKAGHGNERQGMVWRGDRLNLVK